LSERSTTAIFFYVIRLRPRSALFPYTTLFRSYRGVGFVAAVAIGCGGNHFGCLRAPEAEEGPFAGEARFIFDVRLETHDLALEVDRKSTRLNSSHLGISYAVFCLKKKTNRHTT